MVEQFDYVLTAAKEFAGTENGQAAIEISQYAAYVVLALAAFLKIVWPALTLAVRVVASPIRWAFRKPQPEPMSPLAEGIAELTRNGIWTLEEFSNHDVLTCGRVQATVFSDALPILRVDSRDIDRLLKPGDRQRLKKLLNSHASKLRHIAREWEAAKVLHQVRAATSAMGSVCQVPKGA